MGLDCGNVSKRWIISDRQIFRTRNCPIPKFSWPNSCTTSCASPTTTRTRSRLPRRTTSPMGSGPTNFRLQHITNHILWQLFQKAGPFFAFVKNDLVFRFSHCNVRLVNLNPDEEDWTCNQPDPSFAQPFLWSKLPKNLRWEAHARSHFQQPLLSNSS